MIRKAPDHDMRPCKECPKQKVCEDPQKAPKTISAETLEVGCIRFINWLKSPLNDGIRNI